MKSKKTKLLVMVTVVMTMVTSNSMAYSAEVTDAVGVSTSEAIVYEVGTEPFADPVDEQGEFIDLETTETEDEVADLEGAETESSTQESWGNPVLYNEDGHPLFDAVNEQLPEGLGSALLYDKYLVGYEYVVVLNEGVNIRTGPSTDYNVLKVGRYGDKFKLHETVTGQYFQKWDSNLWRRISWYEYGVEKFGYVYAPIVQHRVYDFQGALDHAESLRQRVSQSNVGYISNYKNYNGWAPKIDGYLNVDPHGTVRSQAAAAYSEPDSSSEFIYLSDGELINVIGEVGNYYQVLPIDRDDVYYVRKKYVSFYNQLKALEQVVYVDLTNQNEIVLAYDDVNQNWDLISYTYATSGAESKYKAPTVPGEYKVIEKRDQFLYLDDETKEISGYAPYVLRFNGGAYIHGFPVEYKMIEETYIIQEEILDEEGNVVEPAVYGTRIIDKVDPGMIEYSATLGTIPRSHKCVRNTTSHAEFLHGWVVLNESAVIVVE